MKPAKLSPRQEADYRDWMERIGHTESAGYDVDANYSGTNYDYRGYYKKYGPVELGEGEHLTDEFKLPNHPTFSIESRFARGRNKHKAGRWEGDTFIPPASRSLRRIARRAARLQ